VIGTGSLLVALTAAGIALWRRAGASLAVPVLLVLAAVPIGWHIPPFGQFGLGLFIAAVLVVARARAGPRDLWASSSASEARGDLGDDVGARPLPRA
jgi:hypothetical protein